MKSLKVRVRSTIIYRTPHRTAEREEHMNVEWQPTHTSWWCHDGVERHRLFTVLDETAEAEGEDDVEG